MREITNPRTGARAIARVGDTGNFSNPTWAKLRKTTVRVADLSAGVAAKVLPEGKGVLRFRFISEADAQALRNIGGD